MDFVMFVAVAAVVVTAGYWMWKNKVGPFS